MNKENIYITEGQYENNMYITNKKKGQWIKVELV